MATRGIWRWTLQPGGNTLPLPEGTQILSVGTKGGENVEMWGLVDPGAELVPRKFAVIGTGHPWRDDPTVDMEFLGTVILMMGTIVVHVFEGIETGVTTDVAEGPQTQTERGAPDEW